MSFRRDFLGLDEIITDDHTQARAEPIDEARVTEYALNIARGDTLPDIVVFEDDGKAWLADGFHRVAARKLLLKSLGDPDLLPEAEVIIEGEAFQVSSLQEMRLSSISTKVYKGGRREAFLFSASANLTHGKPASRADRRHAALALLRDPEWTLWSDREIARRTGIRSHSTVSRYREELVSTGEISQSSARIGADGRVINVENIGAKTEGATDTAEATTEPADATQRLPEERLAAGEAAPWSAGYALTFPCGGAAEVTSCWKGEERYNVTVRAEKDCTFIGARESTIFAGCTFTLSEEQLRAMLDGHHYRAVKAMEATSKALGGTSMQGMSAEFLRLAIEGPHYSTREMVEIMGGRDLAKGSEPEARGSTTSGPSVQQATSPRVYADDELPFEAAPPTVISRPQPGRRPLEDDSVLMVCEKCPTYAWPGEEPGVHAAIHGIPCPSGGVEWSEVRFGDLSTTQQHAAREVLARKCEARCPGWEEHFCSKHEGHRGFHVTTLPPDADGPRARSRKQWGWLDGDTELRRHDVSEDMKLRREQESAADGAQPNATKAGDELPPPVEDSLIWDRKVGVFRAQCPDCGKMVQVIQRSDGAPARFAVHFDGGKCIGSNSIVAESLPTPPKDEAGDEDETGEAGDDVVEHADGSVVISTASEAAPGEMTAVEAAMKGSEILERAKAAGDARPAAYMAGFRGGEWPEAWGPVDRWLWQRGRADLETMRELGVVRQIAEGSEAARTAGIQADADAFAAEEVEGDAMRVHERDSLDRYYTPDSVTEAVVAEILPLFVDDPEGLSLVLEPSVGGGAWVRALSQHYPKVGVHGVDVDKEAAGFALCERSYRMSLEDFVEQHPDAKGEYQLVIGNTPYRQAEEHVRLCLSLVEEGGHVVLVLREGFLGSLGRMRGLFAEHLPRWIVQLGRVPFEGPGMAANPGAVGVHNHVAIVWQRGRSAGAPTFYRWLDWRVRTEV